MQNVRSSSLGYANEANGKGQTPPPVDPDLNLLHTSDRLPTSMHACFPQFPSLTEPHPLSAYLLRHRWMASIEIAITCLGIPHGVSSMDDRVVG